MNETKKYLQNSRFRIGAYSICYAVVVSLLTLLTARVPVLMHIEHAIYDLWHEFAVVEQLVDPGAAELKEELDHMLFINLGESFVDHESDRIRQDKLTSLLDHLSQMQTDLPIFLNYEFVYDSVYADQLKSAMEKLGDRLILPMNINYTSIKLGEELLAEHLIAVDSLLYHPPHSGYFNPASLVGDEKRRYSKLRFDDLTHLSCMYTLLEAMGKHPEAIIRRIDNAYMEINYVLRQEENDQQDEHKINQGIPLLMIDEAEAVLKLKPSALDRVAKSKDVIFIGTYTPAKNKYGRSINVFPTPVTDRMPGIYIAINIYLNLITQTYLTASPGWHVFLLNLILGYLGAYYYHRTSSTYIRQLAYVIGEILGGIIGFAMITGLSFLCYHQLFPFIFTTSFS